MSSAVSPSSRSEPRKKFRPTAVDLFCGAGGLTRGLLNAGIRVSEGYDIDPACRFAYEANNRNAAFHLRNVAELSGKDLARHFPPGQVKILVGCAPCQPFSKYNQGQEPGTDLKWSLAAEFSRLISELRPEIVSMENVPEIRRHDVFQDFLSNLAGLGYHVSHTEAYCPDHGVPQQRRRLVLLASLMGAIELEKPERACGTHVRDAISHLAPLAAGETSDDPMHRACRLSELNLRRIQASRPGGSWRDWPDDLVADCHRTEMGKNYPSVYGRMQWDSPAPTITTQFFGFGNGRFGHPEQDRAITLREGAILQSFPPDYQFVPPDEEPSFSSLGRMIGNAVPVRLGESIGRTILRHLKSLD